MREYKHDCKGGDKLGIISRLFWESLAPLESLGHFLLHFLFLNPETKITLIQACIFFLLTFSLLQPNQHLNWMYFYSVLIWCQLFESKHQSSFTNIFLLFFLFLPMLTLISCLTLSFHWFVHASGWQMEWATWEWNIPRPPVSGNMSEIDVLFTCSITFKIARDKLPNTSGNVQCYTFG